MIRRRRAKRLRCSLREHVGPIRLDGDLNAQLRVSLSAGALRYVYGICERCDDVAPIYPGGTP